MYMIPTIVGKKLGKLVAIKILILIQLVFVKPQKKNKFYNIILGINIL